MDTDVISTTSPLERSGRDEAWAWLQHHGAQVLPERRHDRGDPARSRIPGRRGQHSEGVMLDAWATGLADLFADRIIPLDQGIAERAGNIFGRVEARGHQPGLADACIAATANVRGLTVITRNVRHFRLFDVPFDTPVASDRMS